MRIISYKTNWNITDNIGSFRFMLENGNWTNWDRHHDINEYQIFLMLLQNERPVYLRRVNNRVHIFTDVEDTGIQD